MIRKMTAYIKTVAGRVAGDGKAYWPAVMLILIFYLLCHRIFDAFCPMIILTGFPCPGCGITRGIWFLMMGQPIRAWKANPMAVLWFAFGICIVWQRYVRGKPVKYKKQWLIGLAVGMIVVYVYRMAVCFPGRPPMVYTHHNYMERTVPGYRDAVRRYLTKPPSGGTTGKY